MTFTLDFSASEAPSLLEELAFLRRISEQQSTLETPRRFPPGLASLQSQLQQVCSATQSQLHRAAPSQAQGDSASDTTPTFAGRVFSSEHPQSRPIARTAVCAPSGIFSPPSFVPPSLALLTTPQSLDSSDSLQFPSSPGFSTVDSRRLGLATSVAEDVLTPPCFIPPSLARLARAGVEDGPECGIPATMLPVPLPPTSVTPLTPLTLTTGEAAPPRPLLPSPSALGKRGPDTRPVPPRKLTIKIPRLDADTLQRIHDIALSTDSSPESPDNDPKSSQHQPQGKRRCRRNGNAGRIGCDADIGYIRMTVSEDGESEVDSETADATQTHRGWRSDGEGPDVTIGAGLMLTQLLAIFTNVHQEELHQLVSYLKNPQEQLFCVVSDKTDMQSLVADLNLLESDARAADLLYSCKLIQLALNIDQLRKTAAAEGKRRPGIPSLAKQYGKKETTFQNWHTWGCTLWILPVIASLGLRPTLTYGHGETTRNLESLAYALRDVSDGHWRPLVRRFITVIHYLQNANIEVLERYQFVRGADVFGFSDTIQADKVLEDVETSLYKVPPRAADWTTLGSSPWGPMPHPPQPAFAEVVSMQTELRLQRTTALPFKKGEQATWTETERNCADRADIPTNLPDFKAKLTDMHRSGRSTPGKYLELDSDILGGKTLTVDDATGFRLLTLVTMPEALLRRFQIALQRLDAILPGEFNWENSRRLGYSYLVCVYTWYYRMAERGDGAPANVHPNKIHKPNVKVNFPQRVPCSTVNTIQKTMEYEALVEVFSEVLEFQRTNFEHLMPGEFDEVRIFADVLPLNAASPTYPFAGFMLNLRAATDAHKDAKDKNWCCIIFANNCKGGHLCLHELGVKLNGKTGNILIFPSSYVTHFNTHFEGYRATLVLHTDREGDKWAEDGGGWGGHVARHYSGTQSYVRA